VAYRVGEIVWLLRGDYAGRSGRLIRYDTVNSIRFPVVEIVVNKSTGRLKEVRVMPSSIGSKADAEAERVKRQAMWLAKHNISANHQNAPKQPPRSLGASNRNTPIQAYRHFMVRDGLLYSWHDSTFHWNPDQQTAAICDLHHSAPCHATAHRCGLYALAEPIKPEIGYTYEVNRVGFVFAAVDLWGRFFAGRAGGVDKGYRAQFGTVTALLCDDHTKADLIHAVAETYHVPITHNTNLLAGTSWGKRNAEARALDAMLAVQPTEAFDAIIKEAFESGHRRGAGDRDSAAMARSAARDRASNPERATCRVAAAGAGDVASLKHLYQLGEISTSNVEEVLAN
jgi:hypothetical protein